jgi:hypothetical protein
MAGGITREDLVMFVIHMPKTFRIGDSADCRINAAPARVTWRDAKTLVIEPDDARAIISTQSDGDLTCFFCGDRDTPQDEYDVDSDLFPEGIVVSQKP